MRNDSVVFCWRRWDACTLGKSGKPHLGLCHWQAMQRFAAANRIEKGTDAVRVGQSRAASNPVLSSSKIGWTYHGSFDDKRHPGLVGGSWDTWQAGLGVTRFGQAHGMEGKG